MRRAAVANALLTAEDQVVESGNLLSEAQRSMAAAVAALWDVVPDDVDDPVTAAATAVLDRWDEYLLVLSDWVGAVHGEVGIYSRYFLENQ